MTDKSTSIYSLNADKGLNHWEKVLYLFLNWVNNLFPYWNIDKRIEFRQFGELEWQKCWDSTYKTSSPGRRMSDLFWQALPWEEIKEELGEIHVFDTGCGQGNYSLRLWSGISSYTGIDAKRRSNWDVLMKENPNFLFIESSSSDITAFIPPEANLFITQSAIEHFDEDVTFFKQIKDFIDKANRPIIQIHNFPARAVLPLYLFHGVRQYTPRTISKITRMFSNDHIYLYGLGGRGSKIIQWKYFTWPHLILRGTAGSDNADKYDNEVRSAVARDAAEASKHPLFWVLVIHSKFKKKIW